MTKVNILELYLDASLPPTILHSLFYVIFNFLS
jgi:hypothetical protein